MWPPLGVPHDAVMDFIHFGSNTPLLAAGKIIVEKHPDGYVAYPLGIEGVVVGEGDTYKDALSNVRSAIRFHIDTFGPSVLQVDPPILEAFVAEAGV